MVPTPGPASGPTAPRHPQAVTGCEDCLAALLDHDAFVLCRDFKGRTPIHLASACGHAAVLRTLLQAALSTDPLDTGVDYSGYSPMHWASYTGVAPGLCGHSWDGVEGCGEGRQGLLGHSGSGSRVGCREMGQDQ